MKILILGASGMIGGAVAKILAARGHEVIGGCRRRPGRQEYMAVDYAIDRQPEIWLPRLQGVDVVINAVGIIAETATQSFAALHAEAPIALFRACTQAGVRRVVQISALGADPEAATAYWRSKGTADQFLMGSELDWVIFRPSLVFGAHGASTRMFRSLAALPVLSLPARLGSMAPVHVDDLAWAVALAAESGEPRREIVPACGPEALDLAEYISLMRLAMGWERPWRILLPQCWAEGAARLAHKLGGGPLSPDNLAMLAASQPVESEPLRRLLGRPLRHPRAFLDRDDRPTALLDLTLPAARVVLALLWIWSGLVSLFAFPIEQSSAWLARCGLAGMETLALWGLSLLDIGLGVLTLAWPRRRLWLAQGAVVLAYTLGVGVCLAEFWLHPFGPLSKNLAILLLIGLLYLAEERR